jgi:N4-gp56 family major capsid protein
MKRSKFYTAIGLAVALLVGIVIAPTQTLAGVLCLALGIEGVALIYSGMKGSMTFGLINTAAVANTIQTLYNKKLLDYAIQATKLIEFAQQEELAANAGATSVRFYRPPQADLAAAGAPAALVEATAPGTFRSIAYTAIDVSLGQIGQVAKVSDVANTVGLVKYLNTAIELMGEEFALDVDTRLRNIVCHQTTGGTKRYAQGLANFAALAAATLANGAMLPRDLLDALTNLKIKRAPKINGVYVAITPPQVTRDILNNADFREVVRQNYADRIFKGEVGDFYGCRIVEGTNPFQEDETEGTFASTFNVAGSNTTGLIYSTVVTGKGAYGSVNMKKLGAASLQNRPQVIIVDTPDSANPLNQWITVGWKAFYAGAMLNPNWAMILRSKSQYVGT